MQAVFPPLRVVAMAGSLRAASYNRGLLRAAQDLKPTGLTISIRDLAAIPLYNADVEALGDPPPVAALKSAVKEADALLIAVPEYNYGVSGVLKNTIDWLSRPPEFVLRSKPVALMGASGGMVGTARAQLQLRQAFVYTQTPVMPPPPEVLVSRAQEKFDARGELTDDETRAHLRKLLEALVTWTQRVAPTTDTRLAASR
jgi:chromate reductase, NAD(P)H dehydrogenase (quinone)